MRPIIVMPMHDPQGTLFPHLVTITPALKELFARAFISVTPTTYETRHHPIEQIKTDDFFELVLYQNSESVGDDFLKLYAHAASSCDAQVLHLCFPDRVAYALQSDHRERFRVDIQSVRMDQMPLVFQRSVSAWETHPRNYRELEQMVTRAGEFLFAKTLNFAWCHLVLHADQLRKILPQIRNRDLSMVAELPLLLRDTIQTKDVDWLAWEDPFIQSRDAHQLKLEREQSPAETRKRLEYVIPMLKLLNDAAEKRKA